MPRKRPSKKTTQAYLILSTEKSMPQAKKIARVLLEAKVAACVNMVPGIHSLFLWKGKIDNAREVLLIIKTQSTQLKRVRALLAKHHSYQTPEIIGLPIKWGSQPYLDWMTSSMQ